MTPRIAHVTVAHLVVVALSHPTRTAPRPAPDLPRRNRPARGGRGRGRRPRHVRALPRHAPRHRPGRRGPSPPPTQHRAHHDRPGASADVLARGLGGHGWNPPEAGQDIKPENFGGGTADNDRRYAGEAVAFLDYVPNDPDRPFALVASFANPHDILAYPQTWDLEMPDGGTNYRDAAPGCFEMGIELPPTFDEVLALNFKPRAQTQVNLASQVGLGPLIGRDRARNYVNLYAYMQQVVDEHIGAVIDAVERNGLRQDTIIIHVSDHGEMGMSHGGMRQKVFNAYEETMLVPMVISIPACSPPAPRPTRSRVWWTSCPHSRPSPTSPPKRAPGSGSRAEISRRSSRTRSPTPPPRRPRCRTSSTTCSTTGPSASPTARTV